MGDSSDEWRRIRECTASSFDKIADCYSEEYLDKLDRKPADRELLERVIPRLPPVGPVLEVGAGPGQVAHFLTRHHVPMIVSDASLGQLRQARLHSPRIPTLATDLARLPFRSGSLAGIVAYYCLMYGPPEHLDRVFKEWRRAIAPGGLAVIVAHAGTGTLRSDTWRGHRVDIELHLRDPDDIRARLEQAGFNIKELGVRGPYPDEVPTNRVHVVARCESPKPGALTSKDNDVARH